MSPLEPNMKATYETMMSLQQNSSYLSRILENLGNFVRTPHHIYFMDIPWLTKLLWQPKSQKMQGLASFGILVVRVILFKSKSCWQIKCTKICNYILNSCCIFKGWATIKLSYDYWLGFLMPSITWWVNASFILFVPHSLLSKTTAILDVESCPKKNFTAHCIPIHHLQCAS